MTGQPFLDVMNQLAKTLFSFVAAIMLVTGMLVVSVELQASAQVNNSSSNATSAIKATNQKSFRNVINITGTIPLGSTINKALTSEVKTTLTDAVSTAQKLVGSNSSATLALLRALSGYLVYDVHVTNKSNNTSYAVIVDPGSGQVLYHQTIPTLSLSDHLFAFGQGAAGPFFGGHRGESGVPK
jgi:uncharacterized membrane protein YkoI